MKTALKALALGAALAASSVPASAQLDYKVSWIGNTWGKENSGKWMQNNIAGLYVAPDGTCYTNSNWDEGHHEGGIYKNGDYVGNIADLHMNNAWGGFAVAGDNSFLYVANGDQLRRHNLNGSRGSWTVSVGGTIQGLAVDKVNGLIYSADQSDGTGDGEIRCYNLATQTLVASWPVARPRRIAVAPDGTIWVSQRKTTTASGAVLHFSATGTPLSQSIFGGPLNAGFDPTALVFDGAGRLLVGDNGPHQQVKIYTDLNNNTPTLGATFGAQGGIFSETPGAVAPLKFNGITGLGVDSAGNIYVSQNRFGPDVNSNSAGAGSILESYTPTGTRNWRLLGLEFVDCGDFTPGTDGGEIYTKYARYSMDYSKTLPGSEWSYAAHTLNAFKYPTDTRFEKRNDNYDFSTGFAVRIINGQKFQFNNSMWGNRLEVYRFNSETDGEIAIPCGEINSNSIWRDLNGNGLKEASEWVGGAGSPSGNGITGFFVDTDGDLWQSYPNGPNAKSGVRRFAVQGLDANGSPIWNIANSSSAIQPAPFSEIYRMEYISETDTMYLAGYSSTLAPGLGWNGPNFNIKGIGAVIARYDNWSTGNRVARWAQVFSDYAKTPTSMAMVGDFVFIGYDGGSYQPDSGIVRVRRASDGVDVGLMWAGPSSIGRMDIENGVRAMKRTNGEYLVLTEDDWYARVMLYRWTPPATAPAVPTLTATAGNSHVKLSWSSTANASLYRLKRATSQTGPFSVIATLQNTRMTDTGNGVGLANGTTYYYTVQAIGAAGDSPESALASATPSGNLTLRVDSGSWADLGDWIADAFVSGGGDTVTVGAMNTNAVVEPAPADVYKTVRRKGDPITYTFPSQMVSGTYKVRLHFGEWWFGPGARKINLLINGVQLVTDLDVNALAGGLNKAYIKEFRDVMPDAEGKIVVAIARGGETMISGIELIPFVSATPTPQPTATPTPVPTATPTPEPTATPTPEPTATPTPEPTATPTPEPTATPMPVPTATPTPEPTATATPQPTPNSVGTGLTAQYYSGINFDTLIYTRINSTINFNWGTGQPKNTEGANIAGVGPNSFSVRWTGQVQAQEAGVYTFQTETDDGVRLFLDNATAPQINNWVVQEPKSYTTTYTLAAGQKINIKMEYYEFTGKAMARLKWKRPSQKTLVTIPQNKLYPNFETSRLQSASGGGNFQTQVAPDANLMNTSLEKVAFPAFKPFSLDSWKTPPDGRLAPFGLFAIQFQKPDFWDWRRAK